MIGLEHPLEMQRDLQVPGRERMLLAVGGVESVQQRLERRVERRLAGLVGAEHDRDAFSELERSSGQVAEARRVDALDSHASTFRARSKYVSSKPSSKDIR